MNKTKKLIPMILLSSMFVNMPINILAMNDIMTSSNQQFSSADEINKCYNDSIFYTETLCDAILNLMNKFFIKKIISKKALSSYVIGLSSYVKKLSLYFKGLSLHTKELKLHTKELILKIANKMIDAHSELIEQGKVKYQSPLKYSGKYSFETIMNALTVNLERTGEFNSFAKSIILYRLAEYLELQPVIKVIVYYNDNDKVKEFPYYEAVMLFNNGELSPYIISKCMFNPIPFDGKESPLWKEMLKKPKNFNMKEYFLAIPAPNSNECPLTFDNSDAQHLDLDISSLIRLRQGRLNLSELKQNHVCNELSDELIEEIGTSEYDNDFWKNKFKIS